MELALMRALIVASKCFQYDLFMLVYIVNSLTCKVVSI